MATTYGESGNFDRETLDRLRTLPPSEILQQVRDAVFRDGPSSSHDFLSAYEELVEAGVLSWDDVQRFEDPSR